jgi:hypothetical protein
MLHKELEVLVSTLVAVNLFYVFDARLGTFLSLFVTNSSGEIDVSCLEDALIKVVVKSTSTDRNLLCVHSKYMTEWLAIQNKWRHKIIKLLKLFGCKVDAFARFNKLMFILFLSYCGRIMSFFQWTGSEMITGIAYKRSFCWFVAYIRSEELTILNALLLQQ